MSRAPAQIADRLVALMAGRPDARQLVYERLGRLGSLAIDPLRRLLDHSDPDVRFYAAAALLELGQFGSQSIVLAAVSWHNPNLCMATHALRHAKVTEVVPIAIGILRTEDLTPAHRPAIECLVLVLRSFDEKIPPDVRERLRSVGPDWFVKGWLDAGTTCRST
jgi:HEAT repeat protein